tara:strand:+ start:857 stop:3508 length:2652 start_codon:yes stop_codon:yes gene_type:complete
MGEIVVKGEKFIIKGDQPTQKEQLAIDTVLAAQKKQGGVLSFDDQLSLEITPEDVLSDAAKGKYNQDTEDFLSSPTFGRIVLEVGLSVAGGIAGMAAAPFTGGSSLVGTSIAAARIARIARPLLNLSAKKQKFVAATAGAGLGGGAGAAIAQTFDPRESIVKEVARGVAQGSLGEVLGFGMAAGLAKGYNKITGFSIKQLDGAKEATATLSRDTEFFKALKEIKDTGKVSPEKLKKLTEGVKNKKNSEIFDIAPLSKEQLDILTTPQLSSQAIAKAGELLEETASLSGKKRISAELANISPGKLTENSAIETLSGISAASMFGGGVVRAGENFARRSTMQNIDNFVDATMYSLPKSGASPAEVNMTIGELINSQITKSHGLYNDTKTKMWNEVSDAINKNLKRADGTFDPKYDVVYSGVGAPTKLTVTKTPYGKESFTETVSGLEKYIEDVLSQNRNVKDKEITEMLGPLLSAGGRTDYLDFKNIYTSIASKNVGSAAKPVQAELLARMQTLLNDSPLPGNIGLLRADAAKYTNLGADAFRKGVLKSIMNKEVGLENIYKNIVASGDRSYYNKFFEFIDKGKFSYKLPNGVTKSYDVFPNKEFIKDSLRGQFFKEFLKNSIDARGQYPKLLASKSRKFIEDYDYLLKDNFGFLTQSQIKGIKEYVNRIQFVEGALKPAGAAGSNPAMFIQLNQAGQVSQMIGLFGFGSGMIDPGAATFFVLGPYGLSRAFANPAVTKKLMDGLGGGAKTIDSYPKLERYISQLATAFVGQGIVSSEQAEEAIKQVQSQKDYYEKFFETGKYEGSIVRRDNPADAPPIAIQGQPQTTETITATESITEPSSMPLPNVQSSNLPLGQGQQSNLQLAQALNLFNKGGIVSAKKVNA